MINLLNWPKNNSFYSFHFSFSFIFFLFAIAKFHLSADVSVNHVAQLDIVNSGLQVLDNDALVSSAGVEALGLMGNRLASIGEKSLVWVFTLKKKKKKNKIYFKPFFFIFLFINRSMRKKLSHRITIKSSLIVENIGLILFPLIAKRFFFIVHFG